MPAPSAFRQTFAVVISALRLLWRHWPTLFALALGGFIARWALTEFSAAATELHKVVGLLLFALVPISMLVALVLMMRTVRTSLPDPPPATGVDAAAPPSVWAHFASILVPFLAVYAAYDYFRSDEANYRYAILQQEVFANPDSILNPSAVNIHERLPNQWDTTLLFLIGCAILLRMVLGKIAQKRDSVALGFGRGYLEATWIALSASSVPPIVNRVWTWTEERKFVAWSQDLIDRFVGLFGPLSGVARTVVDWFGEILGSLDALVVVPIAWLTIGCVVYGHKLVSPGPAGPDADPEELDTVRKGWERLPAAARKVLHPVRNDTRDRFGPMVRGFRLLKHAGLPTMLMFCVAFVVAQAVPSWLWELQRAILGPQDLQQFWVPISGPLGMFNSAVGLVLLICLVTAAVDHVLRQPLPASGDPQSGTTATPPPDPTPQPASAAAQPGTPAAHPLAHGAAAHSFAHPGPAAPTNAHPHPNATAHPPAPPSATAYATAPRPGGAPTHPLAPPGPAAYATAPHPGIAAHPLAPPGPAAYATGSHPSIAAHPLAPPGPAAYATGSHPGIAAQPLASPGVTAHGNAHHPNAAAQPLTHQSPAAHPGAVVHSPTEPGAAPHSGPAAHGNAHHPNAAAHPAPPPGHQPPAPFGPPPGHQPGR